MHTISPNKKITRPVSGNLRCLARRPIKESSEETRNEPGRRHTTSGSCTLRTRAAFSLRDRSPGPATE
ncbi:hypothetical protein PSP6_270203 [Paraburkholderia tropica]|nr:hypothetical protein PSP6_270203 [Paraburkholderia tropica]